jgi:uncharacterized protein YndB with AHSA1/START domain
MPTTVPNDVVSAISVTEDIAASPSTVFESLIDPEALGEWMRAPNDGSLHDWVVDARPGGSWSATTDDGEGGTRTLGGTFLEVDAPHRLAFSWRDSGDADAVGVVRFTLEEIDGGHDAWTRLTVTHTMSARSLGSGVALPDYWCAVCASLASFVGEARYAITC